MKKYAALFLCLILLVFPAHTYSSHSMYSAFTLGTGPFVSSSMWQLTSIGAQEGWKQGADGHGVHVLVIDTGLDRTEATTVLSGQVLPSLAVNPLHTDIPCPGTTPDIQCSLTVLDKNPNPTAYVDTVGHGSFVLCEIVCNGQAYNYYGVAPHALAAMARVFDGESADSVDVAYAIRWGAIHRFPIESISLGGPMDTPTCDAVAFATKRGTLVVAAAGNSGVFEYNAPGSCVGAIRVSATDQWSHIASWSSFGDDLGVAAPGDFIWSVAPNHRTIINCGGLCLWEGTSMSTPIVSGVLADLLSLGMTTGEARSALYAGANWGQYMTKNKYGHGIINLPRSIAYARGKGWVK